MYQVFNMGVGLAVIVDQEDKDKVLEMVEDSFVLGEVTDEEGIELVWRKLQYLPPAQARIL